MALYRWPDSPIPDFLQHLEGCMEYMIAGEMNDIGGKKFCIVGHFNIDYSIITTTKNRIWNLMNTWGLKQKIKEFTTITEQAKTTIDHAYSNDNSFQVRVCETPSKTDYHSIEILSENKTMKKRPLLINYREKKLLKAEVFEPIFQNKGDLQGENVE
ncbi:hypothetical protein HHI36_017046 [Cryptolaemus montrouzieri]|uniref:Endonuclease/exonuclease/phosphatase domain-containing protein n=1 Tax=Cryptolaemus montrouzieri TaxID=559131 RepID=A0ABD2NLG3_9CUCU